MKELDYISRLDPVASTSYNMYKASGNGDGSFLDFLLKYDSKKANEGDFSSVLGSNDGAKAINSLLSGSSVSADTISNALKDLKQEKIDDQLASLLNPTNANSLGSLADLTLAKAMNSEKLTAEQKKILADKYKELTDS